MSFSLDKVVPWGRSFDEYVAMFALSKTDLRRRILGCGDGPAAFNSVLNKQGGGVVSIDPIYQFSAAEMRQHIDDAYPLVMAETEQNKDEFVWRHITSVEELGRVRMAAMNEFLADFPAGVQEARYVPGQLPALPYLDQTFELALCSHFLFLYSEQHNLEFHIESILELYRVAEEVRIFPLTELGARKSRHLDSVIARLKEYGLAPEIVNVDYEFQKGANQMLRIERI